MTFFSVPKEDAFDSTYWELCNVRQNLVEQFYQEHKTTIQPYTNKDISISIDKMNTGKSPDEFHQFSYKQYYTLIFYGFY
jgi:hypothetical protein